MFFIYQQKRLLNQSTVIVSIISNNIFHVQVYDWYAAWGGFSFDQWVIYKLECFKKWNHPFHIRWKTSLQVGRGTVVDQYPCRPIIICRHVFITDLPYYSPLLKRREYLTLRGCSGVAFKTETWSLLKLPSSRCPTFIKTWYTSLLIISSFAGGKKSFLCDCRFFEPWNELLGKAPYILCTSIFTDPQLLQSMINFVKKCCYITTKRH